MPPEKECTRGGVFVCTQAHGYNDQGLFSVAKQAMTWVSSSGPETSFPSTWLSQNQSLPTQQKTDTEKKANPYLQDHTCSCTHTPKRCRGEGLARAHTGAGGRNNSDLQSPASCFALGGV